MMWATVCVAFLALGQRYAGGEYAPAADDKPMDDAPPSAAPPAPPLAPSTEKPKDDAPAAPGEPPKGAEIEKLYPKSPYDIEGDDIDKGGEVSKACRYDDAPWSDCDPFELIRFRTLRLISGGRQCEESKNITKHCTPDEMPPGTKWLIAEHRKAIAELKRLKVMIADLAKYIGVLREKGQSLFNSYLSLKKHLDELRTQIETLTRENQQKTEKITKLREEMETWKSKARDLQSELDDVRARYHDLQKEHKEGGYKLKECNSEKIRSKAELDRLRRKVHEMEADNSELKRRLMDAERYKDQLRELKYALTKLEYQVEKLQDKLEICKDEFDSCRLDLMNAKNFQDEHFDKDTHMDLNMEMWIVHNKTKVAYSTYKYTYPTTYKPTYAKEGKCLISYYGYTNESCWYESQSESIEADVADTLGHHLVEASWKYFTIKVKDQYECDKAAHHHYEFLLHRCKPKHYLPVLSIFRSDSEAKECGTHIYPKPNIPQPGQYNRCWITFLGPHGHCERRMKKYPLYNTDDAAEGYKAGSGNSKSRCLARAEVWSDYCETPSIATYLPDGVSSNWKDDDIQHDSHGGRMFEEGADLSQTVNKESYNPNYVKRPDYSKTPEEYEDTPEFRQSLNMQGYEREAILKRLRERLGMKSSKQLAGPNSNPKVQWHGTSGEHGAAPKKPEDYKKVTVEPKLSHANLHYK